MAKKIDLKKASLEAKANEDVPPTIDTVDQETLEKARKEVREGMREKFSKWIEVSDETATDEDMQAAKKDFNEKVQEHQNKTYEISRAGDGLPLKTAEFLKSYNEQFNGWTAGSWRGLIVFDRVINELIEKAKADPEEKPLAIDYSTLIFLYQAMNTPIGVGLESARAMAKFQNYDETLDKVLDEDTPVTYNSVFEFIYNHVESLKLIDKMLKLYQERVNMAAAGIKFDFKISEIEEFKELNDAWVVSSLPDDPDELKASLTK